MILPGLWSRRYGAIDALCASLRRCETIENQRVEAAERNDSKVTPSWRAGAYECKFLVRDWGDGYPLLPPTPEAVEQLLKGTCLPRDHVLCDLPPGWGLATIEKIAINAAMAGAKPEQMPVILAALKALSKLDPEMARFFLMSTGSHASLLLVNGPIAKEIGINARAAMGPGRDNQVNLTIGRSYPSLRTSPLVSRAEDWTPCFLRKFTVCVAENEEATRGAFTSRRISKGKRGHALGPREIDVPDHYYSPEVS